MSALERLGAALADRYRVERELGAGGMATVYLAYDLKHDRRVALKVLKPELAAVLGADRFVIEIKTTAALQHPHILPLFDSGTADGFLFYVMPFIDGETLRAKLDRETQLGIDESVKIAINVADALDYAHRNGVIHRDIKPENILLHEGRPMVADFGIALAVSAAAGGRMTETGLSLGTPHYMSPEQATAEKEISARSDIYSLASVLYEMLTGNPPHTGSSAQQIIMKIITEEAAPVMKLRRSVPNHVAAAVAQGLEKLPADRFESAKAFADALGNPSFERSAGVLRSTGPFRHPRTWNRVTVGMTVVAAAALILAGGMAGRPRVEPEADAVVRFALTDDPGLRIVTSVTAPFGISPDGRTVVFSAADASGRRALWVRTLNDPRPRLLEGTEGGVHPAISPDGAWVAFVTGTRRLLKVRLAGGSVTDLAQMPGVTRSLSWASNDVILCEIIAPDRELYRVPATGGVPEIAIPLDSAAGETSQGRHLALPESGMVVYVSSTGEFVLYSPGDWRRARLGVRAHTPLALIDGLLVYVDSGALMGVALDVTGMRVTGEPQRFSQRAAMYEIGAAVALSPAGTLVYEAPGAGAASRLVLVDQTGRTRPIAGEARVYGRPRFSPDGRRIAVAIRAGAIEGGTDLWVIDVATGEATRVTRSGAADAPEWTPDGRRLVYVARVGERREVWSTPLDGSTEPTRLVDIEGRIEAALPTPDGRSIVALRRTLVEDRRELVRVALDGRGAVDTLVTPLRPNDVRASFPRVSPDGHLVAYSERNRLSVHVRRLDGAGEIQVSAGGGCCPVWAPDSRRVYFIADDSLIVADLQTAPALSVIRRSTQRGPAETASNLPVFGAAYDLSPDGSTFVTVVPVVAASSVFIAFNWIEEMKREWRAGRAK